jgi:cytochrome o ubiquinol oxidase subunit IV
MEKHESEMALHGNLKSSLIGFGISLILTLLSFKLVMDGNFAKESIRIAIVVFASIQVIVQLVFFLHLTEEKKPRWNLIAFLFMVLVLFILVLGSLWIMNNLDERTMSPDEMNKFMLHEECIKK